MKPRRYFLIEPGAIALYEEPLVSAAQTVSILYGASLTEARKMYSKFDLQPVWPVPEEACYVL